MKRAINVLIVAVVMLIASVGVASAQVGFSVGVGFGGYGNSGFITFGNAPYYYGYPYRYGGFPYYGNYYRGYYPRSYYGYNRSYYGNPYYGRHYGQYYPRPYPYGRRW